AAGFGYQTAGDGKAGAVLLQAFPHTDDLAGVVAPQHGRHRAAFGVLRDRFGEGAALDDFSERVGLSEDRGVTREGPGVVAGETTLQVQELTRHRAAPAALPACRRRERCSVVPGARRRLPRAACSRVISPRWP